MKLFICSFDSEFLLKMRWYRDPEENKEQIEYGEIFEAILKRIKQM